MVNGSSRNNPSASPAFSSLTDAEIDRAARLGPAARADAKQDARRLPFLRVLLEAKEMNNG